MKKVFVLCLSFCLLLSCVTVSAQTMINVQEPALYVKGFESVEEVTDNAVTLQNRSFEEGGAAGSAGAMRAMFQSAYAKYQPSYGLGFFQFQPDVEYELSMWMKFNNAENIKAPKIQILSYYGKAQNPDMVVYADDTLTTEKNSSFAAGSVYLAAEEAPKLWELLLETGKEEGLIPCGLGARDTLRLEAAMPLYGHEMNDEITPVEAGLGFFVKMQKEEFIGKAALEEKGAPGVKRVGLKVTGRGIIREHTDVYVGDKKVGVTTSGTHCPYIKAPVAMALLDTEYTEVGTAVEAEVRGRKVAAEVVPLPFYLRRR